MGYWDSDENGNSFTDSLDGTERVWGDQPADCVGIALDAVMECFKEDVGRKPTMSEVLGGLMFSVPGLLENRHPVDDDGYAAVIVKTDHLKALRKAWQEMGDADLREALVPLVRDLFMGQDGDLLLLARNRFLMGEG